MRPKGVNTRVVVSLEEARGGGAEEAAAPEGRPQSSRLGGIPPRRLTSARRRRGSRGGRGRAKKKPESATAATATVEKAEKAETGERAQRKESSGASASVLRHARRRRLRRGSSSRTSRRRSSSPSRWASRRSPSSKTASPPRSISAVPSRRTVAGNIYKGVVDNVLPGMEASFVDIGLQRNGFLYVDEIVVPELEGKRHGKRIQELISRGKEVLVQAVKDPMGTKGARLTTEISLPGRFLVYTPYGDGIGVSRRLEDDERER